MTMHSTNRAQMPSRFVATIRPLALLALLTNTALAVQDVLLQTENGRIVTAVVDDVTYDWIPGTRVYPQNFLFIPSVSAFRAANPGFVSFATGDSNLPPGWAGFPSEHDVSFDLIPMSIGSVVSNLFYWNGADQGGNGLDLSDVQFVPPSGAAWDVLDANGVWFTAAATEEMVPGGLIQETSSDIDPGDGVDTGSIHNHLVLQVDDNDENSGTAPPQGVYMIAWQARSVGFETSDPFLFVLRTPSISTVARDLAAEWAVDNIEMLTAPPNTLPGDYNDDGIVNGADYTVWRDILNEPSPSLPNDPTPDDVDENDFTVWRQHFGETLPGSAGGQAIPVPEPTTVLLLLTGLSMCVLQTTNWP